MSNNSEKRGADTEVNTRFANDGKSREAEVDPVSLQQTSSVNAESLVNAEFLLSNKRQKIVGERPVSQDMNGNQESESSKTDIAGSKRNEKALWSQVSTLEHFKSVQPKLTSIHRAMLDDFIKTGLDAFYRVETLERDYLQLQRSTKNKDTDLERLRQSEKESQATIVNLLKAIEVSKSQAKNKSCVALSEASLRADVSMLAKERDELQNKTEELKRYCFLLEEQLSVVKTKLLKVSQEKTKLERDQRANATFARSLESSVVNKVDVEYYKRKVQELNGHVQGLQAMIFEKNKLIEDMNQSAESSVPNRRYP